MSQTNNNNNNYNNQNWTGEFAKVFVELFELYGSNQQMFELRFKKKFEKYFGKPYTNSYITAKVAYSRHSTIKRFLGYKKRNLVGGFKALKLYGVRHGHDLELNRMNLKQ